MADIVLTQVRMGMGNPMHTHVHRHNKLHLEPQNIDRLLFDAQGGGILESTLNDVAGMSGGLTVNPRGAVNIEETYNQRRGIAVLRFSVMHNALKETELVVLCYVTGGEPRDDGLDPATMLVPVRSWEIEIANAANPFDGLPSIVGTVKSSDQYLFGDPMAEKQLRAMRPEDVGNELLGYVATEAEHRQDDYVGNVAANLNKTVLVSKTQNLDTVHHAKQLLKFAGNLVHDSDYNTPLSDSIAGTLYSGGMRESLLSSNPFFNAMARMTGTWTWAGFQGYTLGEICSVFPSFPEVTDITLMDESRYPMVDEVAMSTAYGATNMTETTGQEIAMLTTDILIRCGLTHVVFSATNNSNDFGGFMPEDGVQILHGQWMSIIERDNNSKNRLERFLDMFKRRFFTKFNSGYAHLNTIVSVAVTCSLFGETSVEVFFNGETDAAERYVNATYYLARTSSNIAASDTGVAETVSFLDNLREYFAKPQV